MKDGVLHRTMIFFFEANTDETSYKPSAESHLLSCESFRSLLVAGAQGEKIVEEKGGKVEIRRNVSKNSPFVKRFSPFIDTRETTLCRPSPSCPAHEKHESNDLKDKRGAEVKKKPISSRCRGLRRLGYLFMMIIIIIKEESKKRRRGFRKYRL